MKILVVDIGGTNVKMLASGQDTPRKFPSGPEMTPLQMVAGVLAATKDWEYEAICLWQGDAERSKSFHADRGHVLRAPAS
jgi:hypothetical protein